MSRTLSVSTQGFSSDVFLPVKLSGAERVNKLFCYQLIVKIPNLRYFDSYKQFGFSSPRENVDLKA